MKSHKEIYEKLVKIIEGESIKIEVYDSNKNYGSSCLGANNMGFYILLNHYNPLADIVILAHEYGHFLDCGKKRERYDQLLHSYLSRNRMDNTRFLFQKEVYQAEQRAWENADNLLKSLGVNIKSKKYQEFRKGCLDSYKKYEKKVVVLV